MWKLWLPHISLLAAPLWPTHITCLLFKLLLPSSHSLFFFLFFFRFFPLVHIQLSFFPSVFNVVDSKRWSDDNSMCVLLKWSQSFDVNKHEKFMLLSKKKKISMLTIPILKRIEWKRKSCQMWTRRVEWKAMTNKNFEMWLK